MVLLAAMNQTLKRLPKKNHTNIPPSAAQRAKRPSRSRTEDMPVICFACIVETVILPNIFLVAIDHPLAQILTDKEIDLEMKLSKAMKDLYVSSLIASTGKCGKHSCCSHILLRFFHTVCCDLIPVLFGCRYHSFALQKNGHSFTAMARDGTLMCLEYIFDENQVRDPLSRIAALINTNTTVVVRAFLIVREIGSYCKGS